jgi:predicted short-subunit dehydrogenase-like oxidoreductase (DUF2520 family)
MATGNYKAVIIGAGKIAWSLASAFQKAGIEIISVISRHESSAKTLAAKFKIKHYSDNLKNLPAGANLYLFTVPDNKIKPAADKISNLKANYKDIIFIHFSGVESIQALESLSEKGGITGSMHIMQTFPSKEIIPVKKCNAAVEINNPRCKKIFFDIARSLNLKPFSITQKEKTMYHLTGVLASNFLAGNFYAAEYLSGKNITAGKLLSGIALKALENVKNKGAVNALSGPVERGDYNTVKKHIDALNELKNEKELKGNIRLSYIAQSLVLLNVAKTKYGKLSAGHIKIRKLLKSELKKAASR